MYPMSAPVKRRSYDSSRRQQQARQNKERVLEVARSHFERDGYAATTIPAIADEAGVSVETVYKSFGNKAGLLKAVHDVTLVGDAEPVPMAERAEVQSVMAEPDPRRKIELYFSYQPMFATRLMPLSLVIRDAASNDPTVAAVWRQMVEERLAGMSMFARHLNDGAHLRADVTVEAARDVLWTLTSPELWELLILQRGWTAEAYSRFTADTAIAALL
jgi:AcrR family transcriptional regulator